MHILILSGIILLSVSGLINAYFGYRLLTTSSLRFNVPFLLLCLTLLYIGVSIGFRALANPRNIQFFVGTTGILLACMSILWLIELLQNYQFTSAYSTAIILATSLVIVILTAFFLKSDIATDLLTLPTGLIRYKLSKAGGLLFSICFLLIVAISVINIANFKNIKKLEVLSHIAMLLSVTAVIFPWKEIGLNVVFIALATALRLASMLGNKTFS